MCTSLLLVATTSLLVAATDATSEPSDETDVVMCSGVGRTAGPGTFSLLLLDAALHAGVGVPWLERGVLARGFM